jgi:hypothetical protein
MVVGCFCIFLAALIGAEGATNPPAFGVVPVVAAAVAVGTYGIGWIVAAVIIKMLAALSEAVRDIARNSFAR